MSARPEFLIVGGGIAGLACAYELSKAGAAFTLIEASHRLGGKIRSERQGDVVFEGGPDSFITTKPDALELVRELGLQDRLLPTNDTRKNIFVYSRGRLRPYPGGIMLMAPTRVGAFLVSNLLPWRAKLRMMLEPWIPPGDPSHDESIGEFVNRRFGAEALSVIAAPVMAGIYAGDAERLSLASTFPQFSEMEKRYGSVLRGSLAAHQARKKKPADPGLTMFMTLRGGVGELVSALIARLPGGSIRTGQRLKSLMRAGNRYRATLEGGDSLEADAVVLAVGADLAARALEPLDRELAAGLADIPFSSTATVSLLYAKQDFPLSLDGFGFVIDRRERFSITAATYTSTKFPGRLPPDKVLIRCFVGGAGRERELDQDDEGLAARARQDLGRILGLNQSPLQTKVYRWLGANPQYNVGHAARISRIEAALRAYKGLVLAGSSYRGVGIPDCARSGRAAARHLLDADAAAGRIT